MLSIPSLMLCALGLSVMVHLLMLSFIVLFCGFILVFCVHMFVHLFVHMFFIHLLVHFLFLLIVWHGVFCAHHRIFFFIWEAFLILFRWLFNRIVFYEIVYFTFRFSKHTAETHKHNENKMFHLDFIFILIN